MTFITWIYLQFAYPPEQTHIPGGEKLINESLQSMGKMSSAEWKTLCIFLGVVFLWVTGDWLGVDSTTACLLFFPKLGVISWSEANKGVSWQVLFICGGVDLHADFQPPWAVDAVHRGADYRRAGCGSISARFHCRYHRDGRRHATGADWYRHCCGSCRVG
ncbi:anion permease [Escherichia coli]|nr:anion permease [Escherichia coli]